MVPPPLRRYCMSSVSARARITAEIGLMMAVAMRPSSMAVSTGASRNCQAETPAARATFSSEERVSRQNAQIPPSSTPKGRICMEIQGRRSASMDITTPNPASVLPAARRSSSMKSNIATSPESPASIARTADRKTLEI